MKNVILTAIVIFTVAACDNAGYAAYDAQTCGAETWDAGYDACAADSQTEIDALKKQMETVTVERDTLLEENTRLNTLYEYPVEDWQARAENCEPLLLECRANRQLDNAAYEGLLSRADDLEDLVLTLDFDTRAYNCDNGNWAPWICEAYLHN